MNTSNQSASPAQKPVNWIIIGVVGVLGCICVLAVGLVLGLGFGGKLSLPMLSAPVPTFTPIILPTSTALPNDMPTAIPTETPATTSTPTLAPVPTQSLSSIIEALTTAAQGNGVPEAAAYDKNKTGIHPIVILAPSEEQDEWNSSLPVSWLPSNISQTELIASVRYIEVQVEQARYKGPAGVGIVFIKRTRIDTEIVIRETQTGVVVASTIFMGSDPPPLPRSLPLGTTAYYGTSVAYETAQLWLKDFVEP